MASPFDPYHKWLGIPPEDQPPNHYQLLGLRMFENDDDVIENAAEAKMLLLRTRQTSRHAEHCHRLLNEIAIACHCLLDHDSRHRYNAQLRNRSIEQALPGAPPVPSSLEHEIPPLPATETAASPKSGRRRVNAIVPRVPMGLPPSALRVSTNEADPVTVAASAIVAPLERQKMGELVGFDAAVLALSFDGSQMSDAKLAQLRSLSNLQSLDLTQTPVGDAGLEHLKGLTALQTLNLSFTQASDAGLAHLEGLTSLQSLALQGTQVTDAGLEHLKGLTSLQTLDLGKTQVSDAGLVYLKGLATLQTLALDDTIVTDAGLEHLKGLASLRELNIYGTRVTDAGVRDLKATLRECTIQSSSGRPNSRKTRPDLAAYLAVLKGVKASDWAAMPKLISTRDGAPRKPQLPKPPQ